MSLLNCRLLLVVDPARIKWPDGEVVTHVLRVELYST